MITTESKTLWIKKQGNPKQINISDNQQPSGDKRSLKSGLHRVIAVIIIAVEVGRVVWMLLTSSLHRG